MAVSLDEQSDQRIIYNVSHGDANKTPPLKGREALGPQEVGPLEISTWPERRPDITAEEITEEADWLGDVIWRACDASMSQSKLIYVRRTTYWSKEFGISPLHNGRQEKAYSRVRRRRGKNKPKRNEGVPEGRFRRAKVSIWKEFFSLSSIKIYGGDK